MKTKAEKGKRILWVCNILLIVFVITAAWHYSGYISKSQSEIKRADFIRTIESMKSVSQNYLDGESGYVQNWASYISEHDMTLKEALDFLRSINTNKERFVHIVDMDSYEAYSSFYSKGKEKIDTYLKYKKGGAEGDLPFGQIMRNMFSGSEQQFELLGKYRIPETQSMAVGIGKKVTLNTTDGKKDYLILRVIPVEALQKSWLFPTDYASAEVGIITRSGDYVIQSASMRSQNFVEYIRGYNFQDNYNEREKLKQVLETNNSGTLEYKNFKGKDCVWYYSSFEKNSALDIIGMVDKEDLEASVDSWYIIFLICGTLALLMVIDGIYLISMNRRLRESARLSEQASRAKTQFLSAMSHDIRTPLNAVLGMMTIAKNKADFPEAVHDCMDKGLQSGTHLLTLINDVLDISKIESGNVVLAPECVFLPDLMQELVEMQKQNLAEKEIELTTAFDDLVHKHVWVDKMRLNQIYMNLLTNSVKYTPPGGKILLRLYEKNIPGEPSRTRLIYYLEDNGIGMTEEFQKNMYHSFSREINTQVNQTQGTGLGLSIVKQMVDLMDGTITCNSSEGKGTTFEVEICLPVVEDVQEPETTKEAVQKLEDLHLLVAEDNELNWEIFQELVSEKGISCDHAVNGKECVEMLQVAAPGTYSAILMDVHMP